MVVTIKLGIFAFGRGMVGDKWKGLRGGNQGDQRSGRFLFFITIGMRFHRLGSVGGFGCGRTGQNRQ